MTHLRGMFDSLRRRFNLVPHSSKTCMKAFPFALPLAAFLLGSLPLASQGVDYQEEIRPILNDKCFKCHSGPRAKGKLRMDLTDQFAKRIGGEDPVIVPGDPATSLLAVKVALPRSDGDAMPPPPARARGAEALTGNEIALVKQWIQEGASFEEGGAAPATTETTSENPEAMKAEIIEWTNFEGKTLKAAFVRGEGTNVILRMENGSEIPYPFEKLSPESQELAKKLASEQ